MKNLKKKYPSLKGKFLISSPNINDSIFKKTLIYIISDNEHGSLGIIINKPALNINFFSILGYNLKATGKQPKVFYGGPVELDRGFVLHTDDYKSSENYIRLDNNLALSSDISIIKDISLGKGPSKSIFAIGYTGWGSYQLQMEIKNNDWFELDLGNEMIFSDNYKSKWKKAISTIGINSNLLNNAIFSPYTGTA